MEKKEKIIIIGLVIVIIALAIGVASMFIGNKGSNDANVPQGMQMYDFNSEFKMAVPNNVHFLKQWNKSAEFDFGYSYLYFDKNNEFEVRSVDSPMVTHEIIDGMMELDNQSGNTTSEFEGDLIILHHVKANGKVGNSPENSNFTESIVLQKGHQMVTLSGNDLDLLKSMINTIEFYE